METSAVKVDYGSCSLALVLVFCSASVATHVWINAGMTVPVAEVASECCVRYVGVA